MCSFFYRFSWNSQCLTALYANLLYGISIKADNRCKKYGYNAFRPYWSMPFTVLNLTKLHTLNFYGGLPKKILSKFNENTTKKYFNIKCTRLNKICFPLNKSSRCSEKWLAVWREFYTEYHPNWLRNMKDVIETILHVKCNMKVTEAVEHASVW